MTYGQASKDLRDAVGQLIRVRRTMVQIGGVNGRTKAVLAPEETLAYTELIVRYRAVIWTYAIEALKTAIPEAAADYFEPATRLLYYVEAANPERSNLPGGRAASTLELGSSFQFPLVNIWKDAAVAAVTTRERELPLIRDRLNGDQRWLLIKDTSELVRALVRLDYRYHNVHGWQLLRRHIDPYQSPRRRMSGHPVRTGVYSSALGCEEWVHERVSSDSHTLDLLGYRAGPEIAERELISGVADAIDALHNAWGRLHQGFPNMSAMTELLRYNRLLSGSVNRLAIEANEPGFARTFAQRATKYANLLGETENVSGNLGGGRGAVDHTITALEILKREATATADELLLLAQAFDSIDAAISATLVRGISDGLYLVTNRRQISMLPSKGVMPAVRWYEAITELSHPEFLRLAQELRPPAGPREPATSSLTSREAFRELIDTGFGRKRHERPTSEPAETPGPAPTEEPASALLSSETLAPDDELEPGESLAI